MELHQVKVKRRPKTQTTAQATAADSPRSAAVTVGKAEGAKTSDCGSVDVSDVGVGGKAAADDGIVGGGAVDGAAVRGAAAGGAAVPGGTGGVGDEAAEAAGAGGEAGDGEAAAAEDSENSRETGGEVVAGVYGGSETP